MDFRETLTYSVLFPKKSDDTSTKLKHIMYTDIKNKYGKRIRSDLNPMTDLCKYAKKLMQEIYIGEDAEMDYVFEEALIECVYGIYFDKYRPY